MSNLQSLAASWRYAKRWMLKRLKAERNLKFKWKWSLRICLQVLAPVLLSRQVREAGNRQRPHQPQWWPKEAASILRPFYRTCTRQLLKTEFKEWLKTIPDYPKAFRFQIGSITDLLDFRANDLFQDDSVDWGCEGNAAHLQTEEKGGETIKYYEVEDDHGTRRYYCEFDSRQAVENAVQRRRLSLKRAIEIYMEEVL